MIQIITTGGTIDKVYDPTTGELTFTQSYIQQMIKKSNTTLNFQIDNILAKDSWDISETDRDKILQFCKNSKFDKIIITHGTDTIDKTAKKLSLLKNKTIVLFGAMIPYSMTNSDSIFNFGFALSCVQTLKNGVYVAMNGRIFEANNIIKNRDLGIFLKINN